MRCPPVAAPILVLVLAGCTARAPDAPSLLPRAIETRGDAEVVRAPTPVVADVALDAEVARRASAFDAAVRGYDAAVPAVDRTLAAARSASEGSELWLNAQAALGELGQARSAVDAALALLEALAIDRAAAGDAPYPALEAALAAAQRRLDAVAATDARLRALGPS